MADEVISFQFQFTGQDQFTSAMNQMASAADQMVAKVNAAFAQIKPPQLGGGGGAGGGGGVGGGVGGVAAVQNQLATVASHVHQVKGGFDELAESVGRFTDRIKVSASSAGGLRESFSGILSQLGPAGVIGGAAVGLVGFATERAEQYEKMAQQIGVAYSEFSKLAEVGKNFGLTVSETSELFSSIHEGIHQAAISSTELLERWNLMQDRLALIQERQKDAVVQRQEAEHSAADQAAQNEHSIEQAARSTYEARLRLDEAYDEYQRHGKPRSRVEQSDYDEQQRLKKVQDAEHAFAEAQRAETEAAHKAEDDRRKAEEQRQQRDRQERQQEVMGERFERQLRQSQIEAEERSSPIQRALLAEGRQMGISDFGENLKRAQKILGELDVSPIEQQIKRVVEAINSIPDGSEKMRLLTANFGPEAAAKLKPYLDDLTKALSPERMEGLKSTFPSAEEIEKLAEQQRKLVQNFTDISNAVISAGAAFSDFDKSAGTVLDSVNKKAKEFGEWFSKITGIGAFSEKVQGQAAEGKSLMDRLLGVGDGKSDADKEKESSKKVLEQKAAEGNQAERTGKQVAKEGEEHATAAPKVEKLGQSAEKAQRALEKISEKSPKETGALTRPRVEVVHPNDEVIGHDRYGREILASGHKRLADWGGPGSNILRNPYVDGQGGPIEPAFNVRPNPYVDAQGRPINRPPSREPGWNVRPNPYVDDQGNPIIPPRPSPPPAPPRSGGATGDKCCEGFEKLTDAVKKQTEATEKQTEATKKCCALPPKDSQPAPPVTGDQGPLMPLPRPRPEDVKPAPAPGPRPEDVKPVPPPGPEWLRDLLRGLPEHRPGPEDYQRPPAIQKPMPDPRSFPDTGSLNNGFETLGNAAEKLASAFERLSQSAASSGAAAQHGGMISGPGSSTSDSIHIRASAGEYIMRASAVNRYGRGVMDAINNGYADGGIIDRFATVPRYAYGGEVRPSSSSSLHPVTINLPGGAGSVSGFHATPAAVEALNRHAVLYQASSTGRRPSWDR